MRFPRILAVFGGLILFASHAASPQSVATTAATAATGKLSLDQRVWMASKIYSTIQSYFGHWQAVPEFDLDTSYQKYLAKILPTDDRRNFDLATMELLAQLKNGHSDFWDRWLDDTYGQPLGFRLTAVDGRQVVVHSRISGLADGDVVRLLDGRPIDQVLGDFEKYVPASSDAVRRRGVTSRAFAFPAVFTLTLDDGRTVTVDRMHQELTPLPPQAQEGKWLADGIYYLRLPSFESRQDELKAIDLLKQNVQAKAMIIDVRGNGGGNTPSDLINALIDRPYRSFNLATTMSIGVFAAYRQILSSLPPDQLAQLSESDRAAMGAYAEYSRPVLVTSGGINLPAKPIYTGPLIVLADIGCASSCEDFLMPLKESKRARVLGQASYGSTGQPYMVDFGNGMGFRVSTRRVYFPDGSPFEGVGIAPDVEARPSLDDLRHGTDSVLAKGLELAREAKGK
jgi:carboxyl-terminal processing protease